MKSLLKSKQYREIKLIAYYLILTPILSFGQVSEADQKLQTFLTVAKDLFQKAELPGAGISIVADGNVIYKGGFGFSNIKKQEPVTENTLFFIGSTTKAFTGFATAKLVEKKKLEWKRPVINYLSDFELKEPYVAMHINLEDLFTHMTGLSRRDDLWEGKSISRNQVYEQVKTLDFAHSFRGNWGYNNHAYVVIGKVMEAVSGTSWELLIENEIFKPLGMTNSYTTYQGFMDDKNHAIGYIKDGKTEQTHINSDNIGPAGGISSTPNDISKWMKMLINKGTYKGKELISKQEYDYLMGPKGMSFTDTCSVKYYSIGWGGSQTHNKRTLRHSGEIGGNSARVSIMPDDGFGIFIMTNQRSDYKAILTDYAESIFVNNDFVRDVDRESKLISYNRFIQFQNLILDYGIEAAREYHKTLKYRDFEPSIIKLGESLLDFGYIESALFIFEITVSDNPKSFIAHNHYAKALIKKGNKSKAIEILTKSLELNPENKKTIKMLDKLKKS